MKKEDLFDIFGDIDNQYIKEAHMENKRKQNFTWAKWGSLVACFVLLAMITTMANHITSGVNDTKDNMAQFENSNQVESLLKEELSYLGDEEMEDISHAEADKMTGIQENNMSDIEYDTQEDMPADPNGDYQEVIKSSDICNKSPEFFGGSYLDEDGNFVVVLTEDTPENRKVICKTLDRGESSTKFVSGTYTLLYLTELQEKITNAMINGELPFVVHSGVYEMTNNIVVGVTTTDETELAKLYALDTIGGAIEVESASLFTPDVLIVPKAE